ncbi:MAG: hypothetical protein WCF90_08005 [Methanomicrobiales archaeon]
MYPYQDQLEAKEYVDHFIASLPDHEEFLRLVRSLPKSAEQVVMSTLRFKSGWIYELYALPKRIDDRIVARVWSFHDLTEQKLAVGALATVNIKQLLLSNINRHDIFYQMTALQAYLDCSKCQTAIMRLPHISMP